MESKIRISQLYYDKTPKQSLDPLCIPYDNSVSSFQAFCRSNPGYDAYFINPFPIKISEENVWQQEDIYRPGLKALAQSIFNDLNLGINLENLSS